MYLVQFAYKVSQIFYEDQDSMNQEMCHLLTLILIQTLNTPYKKMCNEKDFFNFKFKF